jgi:hypothetical protein
MLTHTHAAHIYTTAQEGGKEGADLYVFKDDDMCA